MDKNSQLVQDELVTFLEDNPLFQYIEDVLPTQQGSTFSLMYHQEEALTNQAKCRKKTRRSTTFILLIGVCWELSMMFSLAGIIYFKKIPQDRTKRYLVGKLGKKRISCKLVGVLEMAVLILAGVI